jgi:hypothetical protein
MVESVYGFRLRRTQAPIPMRGIENRCCPQEMGNTPANANDECSSRTNVIERCLVPEG